jgi:predicted ArsR family transcriptional regulator
VAPKKRIETELGVRLLFLSWWTPQYILNRELGRVDALTTDALEGLLDKYSAPKKEHKSKREASFGGNIEERRAAMALKHANLVNTLVEVLGKEEAIRLGREEAMFKVGEKLGKETCQKLGVGKSLQDLIRAAKILYRVLGIEFEVEQQNSETAILIINRCALAANYSELTCQVLSATDEGTIRGLNQSMNMTFTEKITSGLPKCKARITLRTNGGTNY